MKLRQGKWVKRQWKINGKKDLFFQKRIEEITWVWTSYSATDYTCLGQKCRYSCPFVSKIFLVFLALHQFRILNGFPRISFELYSHQPAGHLCVANRISLLDQVKFLWCWPWSLGLCVSGSFLLHGYNHGIWPGRICTKLTKFCKTSQNFSWTWYFGYEQA